MQTYVLRAGEVEYIAEQEGGIMKVFPKLCRKEDVEKRTKRYPLHTFNRLFKPITNEEANHTSDSVPDNTLF